jgi:uncharacterized RDD family membrane protein YckC
MPAVDTPPAPPEVPVKRPSTDPTDVVNRRLAAAGLDAFLVIVLFLLLRNVAGGGNAFFMTLAYVIGHFGIIQGSTGQTLGKLLCDVKLVDERGEAPGAGPALIRTAAWVVDGTLLLGVLLMKSTPGHRRLGDAVAGTWVVTDAATGRPTDKLTLSAIDELNALDESAFARPGLDSSGSLPPAPPLPGAPDPAADHAGADNPAGALPGAPRIPAAAVSPDAAVREGYAAATAALDAVPAMLAQSPVAAESRDAEASNVIGTPNPDPTTWSPGAVDFEITNPAAASNTISVLGAVLETELPAAGPEWDPLRQAYVQWDPVGGRLMQYNYDTGVWHPAT